MNITKIFLQTSEQWFEEWAAFQLELLSFRDSHHNSDTQKRWMTNSNSSSPSYREPFNSKIVATLQNNNFSIFCRCDLDMWNNISGGCSFTKVIYWICCNNSRWYRKSSMESWELLLKVPTSSFEDENLTQNFGHVKRIWGSWPTWHLFNKSEKKSLSTMFLNHWKKITWYNVSKSPKKISTLLEN